MPTVATTTAAGRAVHLARHDVTISTGAEHVLNQRERLAAAKRAKDELNGVDTTTPRIGAVPLETVPEPMPSIEKAARKISVSTTVEHRGRSFTITAEGVTLDQFCDLLDARGYTAQAQSQEWQTLPDGTPICPKHHTPMRLRERQGDKWWSHNVGKGEDGKDIYCKGYAGKDSPGYEVK
jgi:hypothetical protein